MIAADMTEKEKYLYRIREKQENGLMDVRFIVNNIKNLSEETVYAELNRLHAADDVEDEEVLGEYSPSKK